MYFGYPTQWSDATDCDLPTWKITGRSWCSGSWILYRTRFVLSGKDGGTPIWGGSWTPFPGSLCFGMVFLGTPAALVMPEWASINRSTFWEIEVPACFKLLYRKKLLVAYHPYRGMCRVLNRITSYDFGKLNKSFIRPTPQQMYVPGKHSVPKL